MRARDVSRSVLIATMAWVAVAGLCGSTPAHGEGAVTPFDEIMRLLHRIGCLLAC